MKLRSIHHLIEVIVNKVSGCNAFVKNIHMVNDRIYFEAWCQQDESILSHFVKTGRKYNINVYQKLFEKEFIIRCYICQEDHPSLFANYKNIVGKYHNSQNIVSQHKRELDAKIEHLKKVLWDKNQRQFADEMRNVELAKFDIYVQYGVDTIKLD